MKINIKNLLSTSLVALIATFAGVSMAEPWVGPTDTAPAGNVSAPINTSSNPQQKTGGLLVGSLISNGPIGIGETGVSCENDIRGLVKYNNTSNKLEVCRLISGAYQWTTMGGKFIDGTNIADAVYMDGKVGIGTDSPDRKLEVAGTIKINKNGPGNNEYIRFTNDKSPEDKRNWILFDNANIGTLTFKPRKDDWSWKNEGFTISHDGYVGIGTTIPESNLHVAGSAIFNNNASYSNIRLGQQSNDRLYADNSSDKHYGGGMWFRVANSDNSSYYDLLSLSENGKVGIQTRKPETPLHINSTADVQGGDASNGVIMIGPSTGVHLSLDNNEIMAKNGNDVRTLSINAQGGTTAFGGKIKTESIYFNRGADFKISTNASGLLFDGGDGTLDFLIYDERVYLDNLVMGYSGTASLTTYNTNESLTIDPNGSGKVTIKAKVYADAYYYNSDRNLKKNISKLKNYRDILKIDAVRFNWKKDNKKDVGIIAQEVQKYFPEFVSRDDEGMLSVDYPKLSVPMLNLLQEQEERLDKQEKEINDLRKMIEEIKK